MTLKDIYILERQRANFLERARAAALQFVLNEKIKDKNRALGLYEQANKLRRKVDRISNHLFKNCWAVASTFYKERVQERRKLEEKRNENSSKR